MNNVKISVFFGGVPIKNDEDTLKNNCPHIVVGTPGRILALAAKHLVLRHVKFFIIDECDKVLETLGKTNLLHTQFEVFCELSIDSDMRRDVQEIFKKTPHEKQVLMFSATLSKEIRPVCKKFMHDVSCNRYFETSN